MKTLQKGFTLIELVVVIVILGILGAVAVPRFVDLSDEAKAAALQGVVGSIESASAINYAACSAGSVECQTTLGTACTTAIPNILSANPGYTYAAGTSNDLAATATSGEVGFCTVTDPNDGTYTAQVQVIAAQP